MNSMLQPSVQLTEPKSSSYSQLGTFYDEKYGSSTFHVGSLRSSLPRMR